MTPDAPVAELSRARIGRGRNVVIERVELSIDGGECVAVIGQSGSGKSTLLETLIGLCEPLAGEVKLFGERLSELEGKPRARLLHRIGVVFQHDALFRAMTVADNLAVAPRATTGLPEAVLAELVAIKLDQVGLSGFGRRYPYELSGGQQKRVAFARAVMLDPELLVCDEPTAGLDPVSARRIAALIARLRSETGAAVLVVTHDVELSLGLADRLLVVGDRQVLAQGNPRDVARDENPAVVQFFQKKGDEP